MKARSGTEGRATAATSETDFSEMTYDLVAVLCRPTGVGRDHGQCVQLRTHVWTMWCSFSVSV
jgi:hypothetical protein